MACSRSCCLLLLLAAPLVLAADHPSIVTPLFAWGNQPNLFDERASRDVFPDLRTTLSNILADTFEAAESAASRLINLQQAREEQPEVVLVVVGSQLRTSDVRSNHRTGHLSSLQQLLEKAPSTAVVPHVLHELQDVGMAQSADLADQLTKAAKSAKVMPCHGMAGLKQALEQDLSGPTVLLMHTQLDKQQPGTPAALQAELQQVREAHGAVSALNKKQVTLYGVVPEESALQVHRRRLAGVAADVGACDALCQVQVRWLEGLFILAIITVASAAGLVTMYMLDTPTKFQLPKDRDRNQ